MNVRQHFALSLFYPEILVLMQSNWRGTARNPTLPEKLEEWSDENFMSLKTTLQQCLPFICYFHISNSDVMFKSNHIRKFLINRYGMIERVNEPFSIIINEEHSAMISSRIDNRPTSYSSRNNPYEFQLLLRGSKDGFAPITFLDIYDGHTNTIVVTKVEGTDEIIDGNFQNSILSRVELKTKMKNPLEQLSI
ncbi:hypothetical protein Glove_217g43 [Diversispora epigaea]|uniref:Uncharacterized protein n=1 Tax=Diversispora epigaea TaxID=1348612 RepID=A0A397IGP9_9GLOM|nr:hypothetical protein Glove_217g43 [Diversispora epigaea]